MKLFPLGENPLLQDLLGKSEWPLLIYPCNSLNINTKFSCAAHHSDQLSNFRIIPDYMKVVDFIEEMEGF